MNPRRKNDILLKSVIEEFFADMLRFFSPEADSLFDFDKGIAFMDKELLEIMPETETAGGSRFMDLLAKVWLRSGTEEWILVHVEVQGQHDPQFARRMFTYYYRTLDRFDVSITAFALFTGTKTQPTPATYERAFMGTQLLYRYNTLQIFDRTEETLLQMDNPFALVLLAAQKVALSRKLSNDELNRYRIVLARTLVESKRYEPEKIHRFFHFLKNFLYVADPEINATFDRQIESLTGNAKPMGIIEALKYISREEGKEEGIEEGIGKGTEKTIESIVTNMILNFGYSNEQIAAMTQVPQQTIIAIRKKLNR